MCSFQHHLCPLYMSFSDCLMEWILSKSDFHINLLNQLMKAQNVWHIMCNIVHNYTKQQIKVCLTVNNDNVSKGQKHVHGSKMQQPFGLFSMTFQNPGLIQ